MKTKILEKLKKDVEKRGYMAMVEKIPIPYGNLYRIVNNQGTCTMRTWEKIEAYYRN
jgi:hypothetical protein